MQRFSAGTPELHQLEFQVIVKCENLTVQFDRRGQIATENKLGTGLVGAARFFPDFR